MSLDSDKRTAKVHTHKDYYYILGVRPDATTEEIQEAYHDLYDKFGPHVSVQGMDPDILIRTFKDINDAYEVLMDPVRRKEYDQRTANTRQSAAALRNLWMKSTAQAPVDEKQAKAQSALEVDVEVTLKEAIKGARREIKISDPKSCLHCADLKPINKMQCPNCHGLGHINVERIEEVELPAGMYDDMEIRKSEQGRYDARAEKNGDLVLKIKLKKHPLFRVLGRDLTITVPVTIYEAMLGAEIEVPSATGKVVMKIQPLTQPGRVYRLKGLGLAGADQLVTIEVLIPEQLTGEEVELFRKLQDMSKALNPRDKLFSKLQ